VLIASDEAVLEEYLRSGESQPKALREMPGLMERPEGAFASPDDPPAVFPR